MSTPPTDASRTKTVATTLLIVNVFGSLLAWGYGIYGLSMGGSAVVGVGYLVVGILTLVFGLLLYSQLMILQKFLGYSYRAYEALLANAELQRRTEEHMRLIAENSNLSEWAKRVVYREKDFEFLRDTIHGALVRQDWEAAEHLISDVDTEFGYHDEAAKLRQQLDEARKATIDERVATAVARFDKLCKEHKWAQARKECERLTLLYPDEPRIARLSEEIEQERQDVKQELLKEYEKCVGGEDIDRAHRLLFELDQYLMPQEAATIKESARTVFRARLEQIKTRFSIAVSYKQWHNAIAAGEQLVREFPNSGYAQEINKLLPTLRERARKQKDLPSQTAHAALTGS